MAKRREEAWAKWRTLVRQHAISGQSASAFCRERGISVTHFFEWRRKVSETDSEGTRFLEVHLAPAQNRPLEVRLAGGRSVMAEAGFDAAHLRAGLGVLEERP